MKALREYTTLELRHDLAVLINEPPDPSLLQVRRTLLLIIRTELLRREMPGYVIDANGYRRIEPRHALTGELKPGCMIKPMTDIEAGRSTPAMLAEWCNNLAAEVSRTLNPGPRGHIYYCTPDNFGRDWTGRETAVAA